MEGVSMKIFWYYISRLITFIFIFIMLSGCVSHNIISEIPSMQSESPLSGVPPKTFAIKEFTDSRGIDPFEFMDNLGAHKFRMNKPVSFVISKSICKN